VPTVQNILHIVNTSERTAHFENHRNFTRLWLENGQEAPDELPAHMLLDIRNQAYVLVGRDSDPSPEAFDPVQAARQEEQDETLRRLRFLQPFLSEAPQFFSALKQTLIEGKQSVELLQHGVQQFERTVTMKIGHLQNHITDKTDHLGSFVAKQHNLLQDSGEARRKEEETDSEDDRVSDLKVAYLALIAVCVIDLIVFCVAAIENPQDFITNPIVTGTLGLRIPFIFQIVKDAFKRNFFFADSWLVFNISIFTLIYFCFPIAPEWTGKGLFIALVFVVILLSFYVRYVHQQRKLSRIVYYLCCGCICRCCPVSTEYTKVRTAPAPLQYT